MDTFLKFFKKTHDSGRISQITPMSNQVHGNFGNKIQLKYFENNLFKVFETFNFCPDKLFYQQAEI